MSGSGEATSTRTLLGLWIGLEIAAGAAFALAVSQPRLVPGFIGVVAAGVAGMLGVFASLRLLAERDPAARVDGRSAIFGVIAVAGGLAVAVGAAITEEQAIVAAGVVLAIHGGAALSDAFNQWLSPRTGDATSAVGVVPLSSVVLVAVTVVAAAQDTFSPWVSGAVLVWLLALVILKGSIVQWAVTEGDTRAVRNLIAWAGSLLAVVVGVVLLSIGGRPAFVGAASSLAVGLSVFGLLLHNRVDLPAGLGPILRSRAGGLRRGVAAAVIGGTLAAGATIVLRSWSGSGWAGVFIVITLCVVGAFFVLPGETIFGAVIVGLVLVWVAGDTDGNDIEADNAAILDSSNDERWIVAIGDSFISGEGAPEFYADTNSPGSNECRRAPTAYPMYAGRALGLRVRSFACSGAETSELLTVGQHPDSPDDVDGGRPQLDALVDWLTGDDAPQVAVVMLSIGGNDSGFSDVITACLTPAADCHDAEGAFAQRVDEIPNAIGAVHQRLAEIFAVVGQAPRVLVTPYPDPMGDGDPGRCSLLLDRDEASFVRRFRNRLNSAVVAGASRAPGSLDVTVVASRTALFGHELCASDAHVNWLRLSPPDGSLLASLDPNSWKNGSLHPEPDGHCTTAWFVLTELGQPFDDAALPCDAPIAATETLPPAVEGAIPDVCVVDGVQTSLGADCTDRWRSAAFDGAIRQGIGGVALALAAGVALGGAITSTAVRSKLPPILGAIWLDYDRIAGGPRSDPTDSAHARAQRTDTAPSSSP